MEDETQVVALELVHGELWTFFPDDGTYGLKRQLSLAQLQRAVAEMTVHNRMLNPASAA